MFGALSLLGSPAYAQWRYGAYVQANSGNYIYSGFSDKLKTEARKRAAHGLKNPTEKAPHRWVSSICGYSIFQNFILSLNTLVTYTSTTRNYYLTQSLQYRRERWSFEANVSFVARSGDSLRVQGGGMMSGNEGMTMNSGIGDVFVRANYALVEQRNQWPSITVGALGKIPTASAVDGFGTGEWDAGVFLSAARFAKNFYSNRFGIFTNFFSGLSETVPDFSFSFGICTVL
jgi:hypothetical protein